MSGMPENAMIPSLSDFKPSGLQQNFDELWCVHVFVKYDIKVIKILPIMQVFW
jgi:hypothetical protein